MSTNKKITISIISSVVLFFITYLVGNFERKYFPNNWYTAIDKLQKSGAQNYFLDSVAFFCVDYDKALSNDLYDQDDCYLGNVAITDRQKLCEFLTMLKDTDYKYICLDIRFESTITSPYDSMLFATINSMDNIIIPCHRNIQITNQINEDIKAYNDASYTDFLSSFYEYPYYVRIEKKIDTTRKSIPLILYNKIEGGNIRKLGPFYFDHGRLCNNVSFIRIPKIFTERNSTYYNWYQDISQFVSGEYSFKFLKNKVSDRIVYIGNMENEDIVTTYIGNVSGVSITHAAYANLKSGHHIIHYRVIALLLLVYTFIFYCIFDKKGFLTRLCRKWIHSDFIIFLLSFIDCSIILYFISILLFVIDGIVFRPIFPIFVLSTIRWFFSLLNYEVRSNNH